MGRKKKQVEISFAEQIRLIKRAGLRGTRALTREVDGIDELDNLDERINKILNLLNQSQKSTDMLYFIMYDIEHNKIRNYIARYLTEKGCVRLQKSVFLGSSDRKTFDEIAGALKEVNEVYDNHDSIVLVPVSTDEVRSMRVIGQEKDLKLYLDKPNTLIF
jgi:CRISPR-associated protein Cas2